jgi:hypothetical protein
MENINTINEETLNRSEVKQKLKDTRGRFFTVTFRKKDGTTRVMNARLGVKAYLRGGSLPYDPEEKNLLPVYDMKSKGYRMVNLDTVSNIKIGNLEYEVQ